MSRGVCRVAELALLGGLGCGGWLCRLLLEELALDYDYCVLQATNTQH